MDSRMHLVDFVDNLSMTLYGSKKCPQFLPCEESDGLRQTAMQAQPRAVNASLTPQLEETTLTENLNTTTNVQTNSILSGRTNPSKAPTRSRRTENRQKWASIKQEVHQLYVLEAKTLQATITIIQQRHSFTASLRKWKMQIKEWNFEKNLSKSDMAILVSKAEKRAREEGKETVFYTRGQKIGAEKFESFKRRKMAVSAAASLDAPTPMNVRYETPRFEVEYEKGEECEEVGASSRDEDENFSNVETGVERREERLPVPADGARYERYKERMVTIGFLNAVFGTLEPVDRGF